jgi:hypothetical protein
MEDIVGQSNEQKSDREDNQHEKNRADIEMPLENWTPLDDMTSSSFSSAKQIPLLTRSIQRN